MFGSDVATPAGRPRGGPEEDDRSGFAHGGWSGNYWDEQMEQVMGEVMSTPFDLLLGRKTYHIFARIGRTPQTMRAPESLNNATEYVASRVTPRLGWDNSVLIEGDVAEGIAELNKEDGPELQVERAGAGAASASAMAICAPSMSCSRRLSASWTGSSSTLRCVASTSPTTWRSKSWTLPRWALQGCSQLVGGNCGRTFTASHRTPDYPRVGG